jgi:hypothetical protein
MISAIISYGERKTSHKFKNVSHTITLNVLIGSYKTGYLELNYAMKRRNFISHIKIKY